MFDRMLKNCFLFHIIKKVIQIFNIVETKVFTESGQPTETRRISPADWSNLYKKEKKVLPEQIQLELDVPEYDIPKSDEEDREENHYIIIDVL